MADSRKNLTVAISPETRSGFVDFCERAHFQKGDVADTLISSFLKGKSLTPQELIESELDRLRNVALNQKSIEEQEPAPMIRQDC
jgi:hypothetical protein